MFAGTWVVFSNNTTVGDLAMSMLMLEAGTFAQCEGVRSKGNIICLVSRPTFTTLRRVITKTSFSYNSTPQKQDVTSLR